MSDRVRSPQIQGAMSFDPYEVRIAKAIAAHVALATPDVVHTARVFCAFDVAREEGSQVRHAITFNLPRREDQAVECVEQVLRSLAKQYPQVFIGALARIRDVQPGG